MLESIKDFSSIFPSLRGGPFSHNETTRILTDAIPESIYRDFDLNPDEYLVKGSVGQGNWADIPWVAIMHRGVTTTTREGFYVALLFDHDLSELNISVALGWTQFYERYGQSDGKRMARKYADLLYQHINEENGAEYGPIELNASTGLSKGYEITNISNSNHEIRHLTEEALKDSLSQSLNAYEDLRNSFGSDIFFMGEDKIPNSETNNDQDIKQRVARLSAFVDKHRAFEELESFSESLPPTKKKTLVTQISRNKALADYIKLKAEYVCEVCGKEPFIKKDGELYAEADHVKPLWDGGKDHPLNMRCLCAQCHRVLTYGSHDEKVKLFKGNNNG